MKLIKKVVVLPISFLALIFLVLWDWVDNESYAKFLSDLNEIEQ